MPVLAISIRDASRITNLSRSLIYELIKSNDLVAVKVRGRTLIQMASIRKLLELDEGDAAEKPAVPEYA